MSKLYSTISGDGRAATKTRIAHRDVTAAAQSRQGSVIVSLHIEDDGSHQACIEVSDGSDTRGRILWSGPLSLLCTAGRLQDISARPRRRAPLGAE
jgi:hypothetical protein